MAIDSDELVVAADASVYVAPVGTTGPADITSDLDEDFVNLGYTSEDGIEMTPGVDINEVRAHQALYAIRRIVTGRSLDFGFTLLQWNGETMKLAFGGGTVTEEEAPSAGPPATLGLYKYVPPAPEDIDFRALVLAWQDGTKSYRLHVPKAMVTDTSSITLARSDAAGIPLTFSVVATDGADPFSILSNDPAFAV
jgi:hypothetical protein